ncbi:hypothetical protein FOCC_FOCC001075 [Frankliniella occidentalis]|nr:hypothetical protein FOCC_FOCC001075 [Frankliniella occidentalis]
MGWERPPNLLNIPLPPQDSADSLGTASPTERAGAQATKDGYRGDSAVGSGGGGEAKLLGFLEEGTEDLRSSTEELQFLEEPGTVEDQERRRRAQKRQRKESTQSCQADLAPSDSKERKDSTCSAEVAFLTSRLSSVGSAASGRSGRSAASSAAPSRSPSPGKLLLETSFCGVRPASQVVKVLGASASPGPSLGRGASPHSAVQSPGQGGDSERQRRRTMERQIALEGEAHAAAAPQEGLPLSAQGSPLTDREERERQARKIAAKRADEVRRAQGKEPKQRPYDRDEAAPLKSEQAKVREWEERKVKKMEEKELELKAEAEAEMRLELENKLKERRNKEKAEKKQRRAGRPRSKSKKDEDALVRIIPLHSSDEEYSEDDDQVGESDVQRRYQGVDAVEDLEVQRRHWLETHVSQDEDPNIVRIIPLRTASVEVAEKERERRESEGTTGPHRQTPRSTPSPKRPVAEPKLEKTTAVYDGYSEDERPPPNLESPTDGPSISPPITLKTTKPLESRSERSEPPLSPLPPKSPQPPPSPQPPKSPLPPRSPQPATSTQPPRSPLPVVNEGAGPSGVSGAGGSEPAATQRVPGRPRGPRRKVDPNALVRIIPLHSEDSYEGYGEDDLPTDLPAPKGPKGSEGVDSIVDEIDMSKWREPSFEENDMVRIIPLKGDLPPPPKPASGGAPKPKPPALATTGRTKADSRPSRADAAASKKSPMMPPEEELVRIIPLHSDDEEREANRDRSPRAPSSLDRSPRSPLPSPGVVDTVPRSEPVRRRRRSDPKTQPQQGLTPGHTGDELVRIIPLHSDSDSETELAGYAAAARAARERPRKASDARSSASRTGSRAGSTSRASSRPGSARSERMEQLQIVPLTDPDTVEETGVCFTRRDLAIQQGRLTPSQLDWHSHGRNTPSDPQEQQGQRGPQVDDPLRSKPATPATLDLGDAQTGTSPRQRRREVDGQSSRSPSPPAAPPPASSVSAGRKASLSSILFRRAEVHSPDEMPAAPAKQRRASAAPAMVGLLKDVRGKSRDRHQQARKHEPGVTGALAGADTETQGSPSCAALPGESGKQRRESRDGGRAAAMAAAAAGLEQRDAARESGGGGGGGGGVFSTLFRKKSIPQERAEAPALPPPPAPGRDSAPQPPVLPIEGVEFTFTCEASYKDPVATAPSTELPPAPSAEPPPPAVPKKSASRDSWPAPPPPLDANANLSGSVEDDRHSRHSSGSEREVVPPPAPRPEGEEDAEEDHETKGLVLQQDSFDDELPYVPVTLPMERSVAVPLVPVKERLAAEVKTCPIDRPRSTTPINPSSLEEYVVPGGGPGAGASPASAGAGAGGREKLRISLPRTDSLTRRSRPQTRPWHDFASQALKPRSDSQSPPPPLPPRAPSTTPPSTWINFDEVPEKRKAPVRIQTIPSRGSIVTEPGTPGAGSRPAAAGTGTPSSGHQHHHHVHYVDPEDCRCECHETEHRHGQPAGSSAAPTAGPAPGLTPGAASGPAPTAGPPTGPRGAAPARPPKARPFGMDLDVSGSRSNRSSVASQNEHSSPEGPE